MRRIITLLSVFMLVACFSGCSVHTPSPDIPVTDLPASFPSDIRTEGAAVTSKWWVMFDDPELTQLINKAIEENPTIDKARASLAESEALLNRQLSTHGPAVNLIGDAGRGKNTAAAGGQIGNSYNLSVAASYEIDFWGKRSNQTASSEYLAYATKEALKTSLISVSATVADLYYALAEYQHQISLTDQIIADQEDVLSVVEFRYFAGLAPAIDVYQARQTLASAKAARPTYVCLADQTAHAISVLINDFPGSIHSETPIPVPDVPELQGTQIPAAVLAARPDVAAARYAVHAKDAEVGVAVADRFPTINLTANLGVSGYDPGTTVQGNIWNIGADLFMPLIDWGGRKAETERAKAALEGALADYRYTVLTAFQDVSDALVQNYNTAQTVTLLMQNESAAETTYQLSLERYAAGLSDYQTVLISSLQYREAQRALLSSRRQLLSDRISLSRALGGEWTSSYMPLPESEQSNETNQPETIEAPEDAI